MREELNIGLAISLNGWSNERRSAVMPINKKYPIETLTAVAQRYFRKTGRRVTFEYVVIPGETDTEEAAQSLKKMLGLLTCKMNLIPLNPTRTAAVSPTRSAMLRFPHGWKRWALQRLVRISRGRDIDGACGQLTARMMRPAKPFPESFRKVHRRLKPRRTGPARRAVSLCNFAKRKGTGTGQ